MSIDDYKDYLELNPEGAGTPKKDYISRYGWIWCTC